MTRPDSKAIVSWLIAQHQMLTIWLGEIESAAGERNSSMVLRLQSHERWLRQSIRALQMDG